MAKGYSLLKGRAIWCMEMLRNDANLHLAREHMLAFISPVVSSAHRNGGDSEIRDARNCHRAPLQMSNAKHGMLRSRDP